MLDDQDDFSAAVSLAYISEQGSEAASANLGHVLRKLASSRPRGRDDVAGLPFAAVRSSLLGEEEVEARAEQLIASRWTDLGVPDADDKEQTPADPPHPAPPPKPTVLPVVAAAGAALGPLHRSASLMSPDSLVEAATVIQVKRGRPPDQHPLRPRGTGDLGLVRLGGVHLCPSLMLDSPCPNPRSAFARTPGTSPLLPC